MIEDPADEDLVHHGRTRDDSTSSIANFDFPRTCQLEVEKLIEFDHWVLLGSEVADMNDCGHQKTPRRLDSSRLVESLPVVDVVHNEYPSRVCARCARIVSSLLDSRLYLLTVPETTMRRGSAVFAMQAYSSLAFGPQLHRGVDI